MFCIFSLLLARASCFFLSISAVEHLTCAFSWPLTNTLLLISAECDPLLLQVGRGFDDAVVPVVMLLRPSGPGATWPPGRL